LVALEGELDMAQVISWFKRKQVSSDEGIIALVFKAVGLSDGLARLKLSFKKGRPKGKRQGLGMSG